MNTVPRLLDFFAPAHYDLSITIDRPGRKLYGTATITGTSSVNSQSIQLHAKDLDILSVTVDGKSAVHSVADNDLLAIEHPDITAGSHLVVIQYRASITDSMVGVYPCYYQVDGQKRELIATQFESHYARQAFPCIDEPAAKATFDLTLTTEVGVTALSNMPIKQQRTEDGLLVTSFETTPRMSTYLLAWVIGDLHKRSGRTKGGVDVNIWATPAHQPEELEFALDIATRSIDFFDEYFGVPYPLPKSDHVALPDFSSGAMENWGLITYREIALLTREGVTTLDTKHQVATVIAHELSHQWFGNLVTMHWWDDLWLNESFANLMEYIAIDALEPTWNIWLDYATTEIVSALHRDSLNGVQAIQTPVYHPDEIATIFDPSIVYAKGGRILRMLQAYLGDTAMRDGLKQYFTQHQYTNTRADDLWSALSEASGKDVKQFMDTWIQQPGFPVVTIDLDLHTDQLTLTQSRFFIGEHGMDAATWPIPLHANTPELPTLLTKATAHMPQPTRTPLLLNTSATAHFITQYDETLFTNIVEKITDLPVLDRLELVQEQILLAKSERISFAQLIPLISHFENETEESIWNALALAIAELKRFVEPDQEAEIALRAYVARLVRIQYDRLGWEQKPDEPENDTKLRSLIISLALYGELDDATAQARQLFEAQTIDALNPELRSAILSYAVRAALHENIVDALLTVHKHSTNSEVQEDIAAALTSTKDLATAEKLLTLFKDPSVVRPQDFSHWFVWLLRNRYVRERVWRWTRDEWHWIDATFGSDSNFDIYPRYIAGALATQRQLDEYKEFFEPLRTNATLARNISLGITELEARISLLERDGPIVRKALLDL